MFLTSNVMADLLVSTVAVRRGPVSAIVVGSSGLQAGSVPSALATPPPLYVDLFIPYSIPVGL